MLPEQGDDQELVINSAADSRNLFISGQPLTNDKGVEAGAVLSLHDETDRVINDQRLRSSEQELRAIIDSMQDTYYRTDLQGKVIRLSKSIVNMLGYTHLRLVVLYLAIIIF